MPRTSFLPLLGIIDVEPMLLILSWVEVLPCRWYEGQCGAGGAVVYPDGGGGTPHIFI